MLRWFAIAISLSVLLIADASASLSETASGSEKHSQQVSLGLVEETEEIALWPGCNLVTWTGADNSSPQILHSLLDSPEVLTSIWKFQPETIRWLGFSPSAPAAVNDLASINQLDAVYLCVREFVYWNRPLLPPDITPAATLVPTSTPKPGSTSVRTATSTPVPTQTPAPTWTSTATRTPTPTVVYRLYGLNFSPYMDGQDPNHGDQISESQLRSRMAIIAPYTRWIRTFGCGAGLEKAGQIAHEMGLKAAIGAWLSSDLTANEREINCLISLAKAGQADIAIVGSEVLLRGDLSESQLIGYINQVRQAAPGVSVATADTYGELLSHPAVIAAGDVVLANYYPYREGIDINHAVASLHSQHQQVKAAAGGKQVLVSETGWPSGGNTISDAIPSPENAAFFFLNFVSWARAEGVDYFYFEAFDETWKAAYEGPQGAHWGVWDKNGNLKPGMSRVFDGETIPDNWSASSILCGPGTPTIEFTYVPPYGSFDNLKGQVCHVWPADYKVAVYIYVVGRWWTKPYWAWPLTDINPDGSWVCDITTGGVDEEATKIAAFLVPNGYAPPEDEPDLIGDNAVAEVIATRAP
ncbi:MAG: hypothetical protein A2Z24_02480 [Candidatus Woykebacteria bacterium RBG_16_44_10]|uniref:Endo-1,3-beta-glucanase btgC n=1 Tax=Candidatus Woykebacteria bacterium RBG_16_44_10 TaxID=1802597 RepID=A0A1G1WE92_9BACT|nr:MAG: hypothetical protein A2Z24_02480 [Candidatus Woykebacteria bacterium RBG_16_44_10]